MSMSKNQTHHRTHTCSELSAEYVGQTVTIIGWVHHRRDHGGIIFLDVRDAYGITQVTVHPDNKEAFASADTCRREFVVQVEGVVAARPDNMKNPKLPTGEIEIEAVRTTIVGTATTPPFEVDDHTSLVDEDLRLRYRYLDLRRKELQENIKFRGEFIHFTRNYFYNQGFQEIQTPILTKSSPEGARDYLVPSRVHPGKFYALPQAPQQYKQFLMVGGIDKYFQIAPAFRDEEPRSDRLPGEFYQLDIEMNFAAQEDIFAVMEQYFIDVTTNLTDKRIAETPFPRIPYSEAMDRFGSDRPDLRFGLELGTVSAELKETEFTVFANALKKENGVIKIFRAPEADKHFSRKDIDELTELAKTHGAGGLAYVQCKSDGSVQSPIWKFLADHEQNAILERAQELIPDRPIEGSGDIIFFGADTWDIACKVLGEVRLEVVRRLDATLPDEQKRMNDDVIAYAWITDFPMYEKDPATKKWDFTHNPFSMPQGGMEALLNSKPNEILAYQYDIVANGLELSSGAIRNHEPATLQKAFEITGYDEETFKERFGHLATAYEYGGPPHGGIAPGIDRMVMLLLGEQSIREVVAFPKNGKAEEPMMNSPAEVEQQQLDDVHIALKLPKKIKDQQDKDSSNQ